MAVFLPDGQRVSLDLGEPSRPAEVYAVEANGAPLALYDAATGRPLNSVAANPGFRSDSMRDLAGVEGLDGLDGETQTDTLEDALAAAGPPLPPRPPHLAHASILGVGPLRRTSDVPGQSVPLQRRPSSSLTDPDCPPTPPARPSLASAAAFLYETPLLPATAASSGAQAPGQSVAMPNGAGGSEEARLLGNPFLTGAPPPTAAEPADYRVPHRSYPPPAPIAGQPWEGGNVVASAPPLEDLSLPRFRRADDVPSWAAPPPRQQFLLHGTSSAGGGSAPAREEEGGAVRSQADAPTAANDAIVHLAAAPLAAPVLWREERLAAASAVAGDDAAAPLGLPRLVLDPGREYSEAEVTAVVDRYVTVLVRIAPLAHAIILTARTCLPTCSPLPPPLSSLSLRSSSSPSHPLFSCAIV